MDIAVIILAAGQGTRMKSRLPKVLHPLCGRPMVHTVLDLARSLSPTRIITVIGPDMEALQCSVTAFCPEAQCVIQTTQCGTADAVGAALPLLEGFSGKVVILYGDTPLIAENTVKKMLVGMEESAVTVLGFCAKNPAEYGRLITHNDNELLSIIEFREASEEQKKITLCNSGVMTVKGTLLAELLAGVGNNNAKGEYYLTDIIALARDKGYGCRFIEADEEEVLGINSRQQLAEAEAVAQKRLRLRAMENGVTLIQPESVTFCADTVTGRDVVIHPHVVFGKNVVIEDNVEIKSFSHIEGATISSGAVIGPFARLRPSTTIGRDVKVGNFVEIKNASLQEGAKANHLSYIGDTDIGSNSNIGAGTITCNYDGFHKHKTVIGKNTLIGSNTSIIAPVVIGDGVIVGAGSVVLENVPDNALTLARSQQVILEGKGAEIRKRKQQKKEG